MEFKTKLALFAILFFLTIPLPSYCADDVVVIAVDDGACGMEPRIKAELESTGFAAVEVKSNGDDLAHKSLQSASRQSNAVAAIRCTISGDAVEIWIFDRTTGKTLIREISMPGKDPDADAIVAFRTVELLRASLLELKTTHQLNSEVPPGDAASKLAEPRKDELPKAISKETPSLEFGFIPTVILTPFEGSPPMELALDIQLNFAPRVAAVLTGFIPIVPRIFREEEGTVRAYQSLVGAGLRIKITNPKSAFVATLELGGGAAFVKLLGDEETGYDGHEQLFVNGMPYLRSGLGWQVNSHFRVRLDVTGGLTLDRINIIVVGQKAAEIGYIFFAAGIGIDVRIWK